MLKEVVQYPISYTQKRFLSVRLAKMPVHPIPLNCFALTSGKVTLALFSG